MRFHLSSEEVDRADSGAILAGDLSEHEWDENWSFWRDPSQDAASVDRGHMITVANPKGWLFAHHGWVVTAIERVGPPRPSGPHEPLIQAPVPARLQTICRPCAIICRPCATNLPAVLAGAVCRPSAGRLADFYAKNV